MANLTPSTPFPSGINHSPQRLIFLPTRSLQNGENGPTHAKHLPVHLGQISPVRKQLRRLHHPLTMPNDTSSPGYCLHFNSCGNCLSTHQDTSNQAQALPHTNQINLGHASQVWKQLRHLHHPPTTPNDPSPPGYCPHFNFHGKCFRTRKDTSNQAQALPHISQNTH